ncbi:MAG: zf-HC2 domain-containing protein, partial [Pyrinomonadaceae bacterium]
MSHEDYRELLALEAAGALTEEESRSLSAHVETCAECRAELDALRETAASLIYTVAPVAPPPELRARILERVRALKTVDPSEALTGVTDVGDVDGPRRAHRESASDSRLSSSPGEYGTWQMLAARPPLMFGTIAAALLIAALAVASVVLWNRNNQLRADINALAANAEVSRQEASQERLELAREKEIEQLLTAPDAPSTILAGTNEAPQARARLVYDRRTGSAVLS